MGPAVTSIEVMVALACYERVVAVRVHFQSSFVLVFFVVYFFQPVWRFGDIFARDRLLLPRAKRKLERNSKEPSKETTEMAKSVP